MRGTHRLLALLDALSTLDGWLGAVCLVLLTSLMVAGAVVRTFSNVLPFLPSDIPWAWEYSSYLMAATFTFGAAMTLRRGGHLRVNLLRARLSPPAQRVLEVAASLVAGVFLTYFTWSFAHFALESFQLNEKSVASDSPLWIPQAIVAFGLLLLALQLIARVVRAVLMLEVEDMSGRKPSESI